MKQRGILNPEIKKMLASLGHTDLLVVAEAGLAIPRDTWKVDLALVPNMPGCLDVLRAVMEDFAVEKVIVAEETEMASPEFYAKVRALFSNVEIQQWPHTEFKEIADKQAKGFIRSAECTPYANVMLQAGRGY